MLTYFSKILITLMPLGILLGCTTQTPDDEKYGKIEGGFPRLVDVPERPTPPDHAFIEKKLSDLAHDRLDAQRQANKNLALVKK